MKKINNTNRKALKSKMAEALNDEVKSLSPGMREILLDDLVTAFQNRVKVLKEASTTFQFFVEVGVAVPQ
jgi:hypothetical protein